VRLLLRVNVSYLTGLFTLCRATVTVFVTEYKPPLPAEYDLIDRLVSCSQATLLQIPILAQSASLHPSQDAAAAHIQSQRQLGQARSGARCRHGLVFRHVTSELELKRRQPRALVNRFTRTLGVVLAPRACDVDCAVCVCMRKSKQSVQFRSLILDPNALSARAIQIKSCS
jgi:hypothetical protein